VIDETHTFCSGPGGYTRAHGLQPDFVTVGKAIGGGIPIGAFGMRREIADRIVDLDLEMGSIGAVGGTLAEMRCLWLPLVRRSSTSSRMQPSLG
jgi:glutamate-1-semialdehyde 2,1-aminomutase